MTLASSLREGLALPEPDLALMGYFGEGNFGDDLLAERMLRFLLAEVGPERIVVSSRTRYLERWFPGVRCERTPRLLDGKVRRVVLGGGGLLFAFGPPTLGNGWGLRRASAGWYWRQLGMLRWRRCRVFGFCLGVGPLEGPLARWPTRQFLRPVERLSVRDERSADLVEELGFPRPAVLTDPVCFLAREASLAPQDRPKAAAIILRNWAHHPGPGRMQVELARAAVLLRAEGWRVEFVSFHPEDDAPALLRMESLGESVRCWTPEQETIGGFRRYLAGFPIALSMRAHGVLLAAIDGAQPMAIAVEPKLRIFGERYAAGRLLETDRSAESIVSCIQEAWRQPAPSRDWSLDIALLENEYSRLRAWIHS